MKTIGVLPAASFLLAPCASWADVPVAVVEDVGGKPAGVDFMETAGGFTEMFNSAQITKRIEEEIGMLREVARRAGIEPE